MNRTTRLKKPQIPELDTLYQFDDLGGRPKYGGVEMTSETDIPSFQEIMDETHSAVVAEATARDDADDALQAQIDSLDSDLAAETTARETADTALGGRIDTVADSLATETANRISADEDLQADIAAEATARANGDAALNTAITSEATARQTADAGLQNQIDAITASSDVKDIVGTKAELNNYDTSTLGNNDIIKVLQDESENNATTYYRWNATTQQFTLIGEEGPYYTKSQADTLLNAKQNTLTAGSNVQIVNDTVSATDTTYTAGTGLALNGTQFSVDTTAIATQSDLTAGLANKQDTLTAGANIQINNNTISATDTTYSDFTGTDGTAAGTAGLVPAPATTDAGKFLKADGTWDTAGGGGGGDTVYSDKSTSNSATGGAVYIGNLDTNQDEQPDPTTTDNHFRYFWALPQDNKQIPQQRSINIFGQNEGMNSISLGVNAIARLDSQVAIGAQTLNNYSATEGVALGYNAKSQAASSVALGARATATRAGEVNVGNRSGEGFNNTEYRVIGGVYDGQLDHDVVTVGQLNGRISQNAGAPITATVGTVGQLLEDTTNGKLYQCTAVDTTDPNNPSYTWSEVGAGGGGGGAEFIELTTADYNWNSSTGATGTPNCVALWLLPSGIYKGPASTSIEVRATRTQDYSMGAGFSSYAIVKECENTNTNRAIVTYVDGANGSVVEYYSIDENGQNYSTKNFPNVVQTTGTSTSDVMSQNAVTSMVFADPSTKYRVQIGSGSSASGTNSVAIGRTASAAGNSAVGIRGKALALNSVAIGGGAQATAQGQFDIGTSNGATTGGYNNSAYRLLTGLYDPQSAHDAATKGYVDGLVGNIAAALNAINNGGGN